MGAKMGSQGLVLQYNAAEYAPLQDAVVSSSEQYVESGGCIAR